MGRQAGGGGLDAGPVCEHRLGRGRAGAVAGAEEEEVGQANALKLVDPGDGPTKGRDQWIVYRPDGDQ